MDILFGSSKLQEECNSDKLLRKRHPLQRAKLIRRRLDDLQAASCLQTMRNLAGRCHELREDRKGQLTVDLDGPYRLVFEPADDPLPAKPDGGLDWARVTTIRILDVENTHE